MQIAGWCVLCKSRCGATFRVEDRKLPDAGFFREHFLVKGTEAANACARTVENIAGVRKLVA